MLKVTGIHKKFNKHEVLKGIDLTVNKGNVVVILGPSGSGKTTLLRCINFLEKADSGHLDFDEISLDYDTVTGKQIHNVRKKTAFVFQNYNLFNNKTVLENVAEGLIYGHGVEAQLSGGQQQRVGIARAIAIEPEVILFDEPTSALDPELIGEVLTIIRQLAKEGKTMVIVTHEMQFAREIATHVIFMEDGIIVEEGDPEKVFSKPEKERTRQFLSRVLTPEYMI